MKRFAPIIAAAVLIGSLLISTAGANAAQTCTTRKVPVTHVIKVKVKVRVHGKIVTKTVSRKVIVRIKVTDVSSVGGKLVVKDKLVIKYKKVTTCIAVIPPVTIAPTTTTTTPPPPTTTTTIPGPAAIGTTQTISDSSGDHVSVDVQAVLDPATPATSFDTPPAGDRLVAVQVLVTNLATGIFDDDMNNDVVLVGTNSQTYSSSFEDVAGCTNFNFGEVDLTTAQQSDGCVSFDVPIGQSLSTVQFKPGLDFSTGPLRWVG